MADDNPFFRPSPRGDGVVGSQRRVVALLRSREARSTTALGDPRPARALLVTSHGLDGRHHLRLILEGEGGEVACFEPHDGPLTLSDYGPWEQRALRWLAQLGFDDMEPVTAAARDAVLAGLPLSSLTEPLAALDAPPTTARHGRLRRLLGDDAEAALKHLKHLQVLR